MDALKGAMATLAASFLVAILFAYLFRIPVPMGGMIGPFGEFSAYGMAVGDVLKTVLIAWMFYGMFGGFIIPRLHHRAMVRAHTNRSSNAALKDGARFRETLIWLSAYTQTNKACPRSAMGELQTHGPDWSRQFAKVPSLQRITR